jgi:NADH:ubiquinone oxidoreductase subunit 3 (subunit A)
MEYIYLALFGLTGALMVAGAIFVSTILAPKKETTAKGSPYECGEKI